MLANNVPLIVTAGPEGVVAKIQGADILLLSTNNTTLAFTLFRFPDIKKPEDLRGKRPGSAASVLLRITRSSSCSRSSA